MYFSLDLAMACIEEDLEKPIKEIFKTIDKEPISAASLGQVHKAMLKDGTKVAAGGSDKKVTLYDLHDRSLILHYKCEELLTMRRQNFCVRMLLCLACAYIMIERSETTPCSGAARRIHPHPST